jgi:hypothetical protein
VNNDLLQFVFLAGLVLFQIWVWRQLRNRP